MARLALLPAAALALACFAGAAAAATDVDASSCAVLRLRDRNLAALERRAEEAAGLGSPNAGRYLSADEVAELTGRTPAELQSLSDFVSTLGGHLAHVGPLRDAAVACLPRGLAAAANDASLNSKQQTLVAATRRTLLAAGSPAGSAAEALAAALPPHLASITAAIVPLGSERAGSASSAPSGRRLQQAGEDGSTAAAPVWRGPAIIKRGSPLQPPAFGAEGGASAATALPDWQPVKGAFKLQLPSGYGAPLRALLGEWNGWQDPATNTAWAVPQFSFSTLLYFLGIKSYAGILNNINTESLASAAMVPCRLTLGAGGAVTGVGYATVATAAACMPKFSVSYRPTYTAEPAKFLPNVTLPVPASAVSVMSCGAAVARARGRLPPNTCTLIGRQLAAQTNISTAAAPIDNSTALYLLDLAQVLPTFVGMVNTTVSARLPDSVPATYRNFGVLAAAGPPAGLTLSVAGRNRPQELRQLYSAPPRNNGTAKGLLAGVAVCPELPYDYSPADLQAANSALGMQVPPIVELVNKPYFPPNSPRLCYAEDGVCVEPSLDTQMITQYGQGSGASFGFAASPVDVTAFWGMTNPQLFGAYLGLKPLPDVLSLSWGGLGVDPADGVEPVQGEAVLAKMAAMGVTMLVSSGDSGARLGGDADSAAGACAKPIAASYPAASRWVTAIGAVMQARPVPGKPPTWAACMSTTGGLITSGGGFGNVSLGATPPWQAAVVSKYIASQKARPDWPLSSANAAATGASYGVRCSGRGSCVYGRAIPDLSLVGAAVPVVSAGAPTTLYGTSVSAPVFAGLVMQLNAAIRATPGLEKCKIGYMTPFLYWAAEKYPAAFTDVIYGANKFPEQYAAECAQGGYYTAKGWDAVTGLGVPNMAELQQAAIQYVKLQGGCARS
ncbi:hypothetical protein ABPG75_012492 [Micractinium tetrahymenae]